jgi:hypothetical protein
VFRFITAMPNAMIVMKETPRPNPRVSPMDSRDIPDELNTELMLVFCFLFSLMTASL